MSCTVGQPPCSSDPNRSNTCTTRTCSLALVEQRFKRAIDSSLPQKREDNPPCLAIAYSGGLGSTVLLDLASRLLAPNGRDNSPRRRWKDIRVLHIEKQETNCSSTAQWAATIGRYPEFKFKALRLADDFQTIFPSAAPKPSFDSLSAEPSSPSLEQYLHGLPTESARVATMRNLTRLAVEHHARVLGASHLLLGTSLSSISSSMVSRICQGGGFTLATERGRHIDNLHVIAPLQDVMAKECAAWLKWNDLQTMGGTVPKPLASIESLTRGKRFCQWVSSR
jgi:cytoplasmic tRNA 2-thiolation protein 2